MHKKKDFLALCVLYCSFFSRLWVQHNTALLNDTGNTYPGGFLANKEIIYKKGTAQKAHQYQCKKKPLWPCIFYGSRLQSLHSFEKNVFQAADNRLIR
jgi:hypothetical protein